MLKTVFEKETCGRCGGSGRYSYNQMHGSVCYGCGGHGERLTKRGATASARYVEGCKIRYADVVVGDVVSWQGVTMGGSPYTRKGAVEEIAPYVQRYKSDAACHDPDAPWQEIEMVSLARGDGDRREWATGLPDALIRKYWAKEINDAKIADALAYQATLTKTGKPAKVRA